MLTDLIFVPMPLQETRTWRINLSGVGFYFPWLGRWTAHSPCYPILRERRVCAVFSEEMRSNIHLLWSMEGVWEGSCRWIFQLAVGAHSCPFPAHSCCSTGQQFPGWCHKKLREQQLDKKDPKNTKLDKRIQKMPCSPRSALHFLSLCTGNFSTHPNTGLHCPIYFRNLVPDIWQCLHSCCK